MFNERISIISIAFLKSCFYLLRFHTNFQENREPAAGQKRVTSAEFAKLFYAATTTISIVIVYVYENSDLKSCHIRLFKYFNAN